MTAGVTELTRTATTARTLAPAKLNLTLEIVGRRRDGFHDLRSLVIGVGLCDDLRMAIVPHDGITIDCDQPALANRENLAVRAAEAVASRTSHRGGFHLRLAKRIPVAAGLGGGSSDAAAALRLADGLLGADLGGGELTRLAAQLGSDVPLFFHLPGAIMTGRGERVEPVMPAWSGWVMLAVADIPVSTRAVYEARRPSDSRGHACPSPDAILRTAQAEELSPLLFNDLEPAVFRVCPKIGELSDTLHALNPGPFRVCGAGSTFFRLFDDRDEARRTARIIEERIPQLRCLVAAGPVNVGNITFEEH
jgi:4-diphosphocytidyl-2-C-methyl-D-erythritol kinase